MIYAQDDWKKLLFMFGTYALAYDNPESVVVFGHTKAAIEELFIQFVREVQRDTWVCDQIEKRAELAHSAMPVDVYWTCELGELQAMAALGHTLRIAYNHSCCGDQYSGIVDDEVTRHHRGAYRVVFCTSTYAAGINLWNFNHVFIDGDKERLSFGRVCRPSEIAQMAGRGARWRPGICFCHAFTFDQQFEEMYEMSDISEKKLAAFRLSPSSMPSVEHSYEIAAEVIARCVGRSILAIMLEFIDHVIDNLICFNKVALCTERAAQRDCVLCVGVKMFRVISGEINRAKFTGHQEGATHPMTDVWLSSTSDIVALDCAGLEFEHFDMIERLIMSSR
jgi:hypothetical protein